MSALLNTIDPDGENISFAGYSNAETRTKFESYFKNCDIHDMRSSVYWFTVTNIHRTKDGRYSHLHGSMNREPTQQALGLAPHMEVSDPREA